MEYLYLGWFPRPYTVANIVARVFRAKEENEKIARSFGVYRYVR